MSHEKGMNQVGIKKISLLECSISFFLFILIAFLF